MFESDDFEVADAVANAPHTVLDATVNLRSQCEALAKEKGLYSEKRGGWITWKQAQEARVKCLDALNAYTGTDVTTRKQMLHPGVLDAKVRYFDPKSAKVPSWADGHQTC